MRRLGIIAAITCLTILLGTATCFAALDIVDSYPRDGGGGLQPVNCAVKIFFNQDVSSEKYLMSNSECFRVTDSEGVSQPITVYHDSKDKTMVLVVLNETLQEDARYKLTISGDFTATSGDTLETERTISFRTRNVNTDMTVSMVMMVVMFVGILIFSSRQMKRQAQKEAEEKDQRGKVNPYKVAKKTGKSVDEVVRKTEREKQKKASTGSAGNKSGGAEKEKKEAYSYSEVSEEIEGNRRVKGPRPISAAGSTYLSGKKAKAEAEAKRKAAARAAGTTRPKNQSAKKRNKKK